MVAPTSMATPGAAATTGASASANPAAGGEDLGAVLQAFMKMLSGAGAKKSSKGSASAFIQGSGAFSIRPLGEQVKVADGKQGDADYWSALGYNA